MKPGDRISLIDDDMKGTVTAVKGEMITFRDAHGFMHEYPKNKLVIRNPSLYEGKPVIKKAEPTVKRSKKHQQTHKVLDLHFENLVSNPAEHSAFERLLIQKEKLEEAMAYCRRNRLKKLEIIHGIGDGVLQNMVFEYLRGQTGIDFEDHDFFYHQTGSVMVRFR